VATEASLPDASRDVNRLSLLPRHAAQPPGCPGRIGPAGLSDGRSARPCTRARTMVPGQRRRRVVAGPRRHRSSRPEPLYAAAAPTCPRRSTPQLLPSWTSHRPVIVSGAPAEWCHDAGLHRRKARRQDDKCRDRQNRKYMMCDPCVHILTLAERQKDPRRKPKRRSRRDPAVFAIDSTRRMSEPDLAASGFTVSEVAYSVRARRRYVMNLCHPVQTTGLAVLERRGGQTRLIRRVGRTGISRRPARCAYRGIGLPYKTQPK
jgi:hypothetical protein